jgi:hypothetical protein
MARVSVRADAVHHVGDAIEQVVSETEWTMLWFDKH